MNEKLRLMLLFLWVAVCVGGYSPEVRAEKQTPEQRTAEWLGDVRLPAKNYVQDGSFEFGERWVWFQHKTGGVESGTAATGKNAFHMVGNDPNRHFYYHQYNVPLETGKTYTLSAMVKTKGLTKARSEHGVLFLCNYGWDSDSISMPAPKTAMEWTRVSTTFVAPRTKPRADGKPAYTLTIYWPPKSEGEFWLDDIQIEDGAAPTAFSDIYVGDGIKALDQLRLLAGRIFVTREALGAFKPSGFIRSSTREVDAILGQAEAVRNDLKQMGKLSKPAREDLVKRVEAASVRLAKVRTVVWIGSAYTPLKDATMPQARPEKLEMALTCLKGEHRDFAVNVANLTSEGYPSRLIVSDLHNESLAWWISPDQWMTGYSSPRMRGFSKPAEVFTDALPELDRAGIFYVEPAGVSQAIVSIDTAGLLPGEYTGTIGVASMVDAANRQEVAIKLHVLGRALLPLTKVDIVECFGHTPYAWEAMVQLGVNTFDLNASWMDVEFNDDGGLNRIDFSRIDQDVHHALADVPDARFLIFSGQGIFSFLEGRYGWKATEPRFEKAFKAWIKALADHLGSLNVASSRLIIETYDEPGEGDFAAGTLMARWIRQVDPALQTQYYVTGIGQDEGWKNNALAHTIVAPIVAGCTPENMKFLKSLGKKMWVYDCAGRRRELQPDGLLPAHALDVPQVRDRRLGTFLLVQQCPRPWARLSAVGRGGDTEPGVSGDGRPGDGDLATVPGPAGRTGGLPTARCPGGGDGRGHGKTFSRGDGSEIHREGLRPSPELVAAGTRVSDPYRTGHVGRSSGPDSPRNPGTNRGAATGAGELAMTLDAMNMLSVRTPDAGKLRVRYLVNGKLPWHTRERQVLAGDTKLALGTAGEVNRCLVDFTDRAGRVWAGTPLIIPQIRVDSTSASYSPRPLNDGLRVAAVKFEPQAAWISGPAAREHWVQMDLGRSRRVSQVSLFWMTLTGLPQKTMIQYADEAGTWRPVSATPDFRPASGAVEVIRFSPLRTSKLRVLLAPNGGGKGGPSLMGLSEVEVR